MLKSIAKVEENKRINAQVWLDRLSSLFSVVEEFNINKFTENITLMGEISFSDLPHLKRIVISDHDLTAIDVSNCTELEEIDCSNNPNLSKFKNNRLLIHINNKKLSLNSNREQMKIKYSQYFELLKKAKEVRKNANKTFGAKPRVDLNEEAYELWNQSKEILWENSELEKFMEKENGKLINELEEEGLIWG